MLNTKLLILGFLVSLISSIIITFLIRKMAVASNLLVMPGGRRVHKSPIPCLGGFAIYCSFVIGIFFLFFGNTQLQQETARQIQGILIAGTFIVVLGIWDDIKEIKPIIKLFGQIAVAVLLFKFGFRVNVLTNPLQGEMQIPLFLNFLITIGWFVGLMNAMNLIDGLDGLASGIAIIASIFLVLVSVFLNNQINIAVLVILIASALGFLYFNFYPAKIFMGDSGSMFLGLILGAAALMGSQHKSATAAVLLVPMTALAVPIYDTAFTILRRAWKKYSIFRADKRHLHHRLLDIGLKQNQIVLFLYAVTIYLGIFSFLFVLIPEKYALILLILLAFGFFMGMIIVTFLERKLTLVRRLESRRRHEA